MTKARIDNIEHFFDGESKESSSKINLLSKKEKSRVHGIANTFATELLDSWKEDIFSVLFPLKNSLLLMFETGKLYVVTLLLIGLFIPIFLFLGGILLVVFLLSLGFLPVIGGMLIIPLLTSSAVTVSASIGWYLGSQIFEIFRRSLLFTLISRLCYRWYHSEAIQRMLHHFKIIPTKQEQLSKDSHSDSNGNESSVNDLEAEENRDHHNIDDIHRIQNVEPQPVNILNELQSDWDDIEGESSMTYYSFSEIKDNYPSIKVNETSLDNPQQTFSQKHNSEEGYSDLGIHRIEKLKSARDILSEMKKHSKPHIFQ